MTSKKVLILASPRSGTSYIHVALREIGIDVGNEDEMGKDGLVSWWALRGRTSFKDTAIAYKWKRDESDHSDFDVIVHQVRNPLKVIGSQFTLDKHSMAFMTGKYHDRFYYPGQNDDKSRSRMRSMTTSLYHETSWYDPALVSALSATDTDPQDASLHLGAMHLKISAKRVAHGYSPSLLAQLWIDWNDCCRSISEFTYRVEDISTSWETYASLLNCFGREDLITVENFDKIKKISTKINTRNPAGPDYPETQWPHKSSVKSRFWKQVKKNWIEPEVWEEFVKKSREYGYTLE